MRLWIQSLSVAVLAVLVVVGTVQASLVRGALVAFPPCCWYVGISGQASGPCDACQTLDCCLTGCRGYCSGLAYNACRDACYIKFTSN